MLFLATLAQPKYQLETHLLEKVGKWSNLIWQTGELIMAEGVGGTLQSDREHWETVKHKG